MKLREIYTVREQYKKQNKNRRWYGELANALFCAKTRFRDISD